MSDTVRFEWDEKHYEEDFGSCYNEPDIQLIIGDTIIAPPPVRIGSNVWDTLLSIYQVLRLFDLDKLGDRDELIWMHSNTQTKDEIRYLAFDERVYDVHLLPADNNERIRIKYEGWNESVRSDKVVETNLKDFVRGILDSNVRFFEQIRQLNQTRHNCDEGEHLAYEQLDRSFQIIKKWYFERWDPLPREDDPLIDSCYKRDPDSE